MSKNKAKLDCIHNHPICQSINQNGGNKGGAACLILIKNADKTKPMSVVFGYDKYRQGYTLCSGSRKVGETCYIEVMQRELKEEFKIDIDNLLEDPHFIDTNTNNIRHVVYGGSPVFIAIFEAGELDLGELNTKIVLDNANDELHEDFKEMARLKLFDSSSIVHIKKPNLLGKMIDNYLCKVENCEEVTYHRITSFTMSAVGLAKRIYLLD